MKLAKKIAAILLAVVLVLSFAACAADEKEDTSIKIGVIEIGDDTETYTKAHADASELLQKSSESPAKTSAGKKRFPRQKSATQLLRSLLLPAVILSSQTATVIRTSWLRLQRLIRM